MEVDAAFIPKLLKYDIDSLTLYIQRINGMSLFEILQQNKKDEITKYFKTIIDQLIIIDAFLYDNRINVLQISPKDLIFDFNVKKLYLVDLEYTVIKSSYKQVLYDRLFHTKLFKISNNLELRDLFLNSLKNRKRDFKLYYYRKILCFIIKSCRSVLPFRAKKEYKDTKIKLSY